VHNNFLYLKVYIKSKPREIIFLYYFKKPKIKTYIFNVLCSNEILYVYFKYIQVYFHDEYKYLIYI